MKYVDIPEPMRNALGTHEMLRRLGFASDDIYWDMRVDGMMQIVLKTQGKQFVIDVGVLPDMTYEQWQERWKVVMAALLAKQISAADYARLLSECESYRFTSELAQAIARKGIRIPAAQRRKN